MFDDEKVWFDYSLNPRRCLPATARHRGENLFDRSANDARDPITPATTATSLLGRLPDRVIDIFYPLALTFEAYPPSG